MKQAAVNGTQLAYLDAGPAEGEPVVLSHSLFFDHSMFDVLGERLAAAGYRVIAYDHRNQGASAPAERDELDLETAAEDAEALIAHLDLGRLHFVGNSLGGMVALRLAARHPDLLLTVTAAGASAEEEHALAQFGPLNEQLALDGGAPHIDTLLYIMFGDTSLEQRSDLVAPWRVSMSTLAPSIAHSAHGVIYRRSIIDELQGCQVPVLAIAGAEDHAYPQPISGENIAAATGGQQVTVEAAGHSVSLEQPEVVFGHLTRFFAGAKARAGTA